LKRDNDSDKFTYKKQLVIGLGPHLLMGEDQRFPSHVGKKTMCNLKLRDTSTLVVILEFESFKVEFT